MKDFLNKNWIIILLTAAALLLRVWGIQFGKPFRYHPDEIKLVAQAGRLLEFSNWNKALFFSIGIYPPLLTFIYAAVFGVYGLVCLVVGIYPATAAIRDAYHANPFVYHLLGRWIAALMGTASVPILFLIGKKVYGSKIGLISALLLTVSFLHVRNSHFATVDIPATFMVLVTFYFIVKIFQRGDFADYFFSGMMAGLAIAMKYNAGLILVPLLMAHVFRTLTQKRSNFFLLFGKKPLTLAASGIIFFLIGCPLPLIDFCSFKEGLMGTAEFESVGKLGSGGGYLSYLTGQHSPGFGLFADNNFTNSLGLLVTIFVGIGVIFFLIRHTKKDILVVLFPVISFAFFSTLSYKAMRHLLPIVPFLCLILAVTLYFFWSVSRNKAYRVVLIFAFVSLLVGEPMLASLRSDLMLTSIDPRTEAKSWIEDKIADSSKIGVERFGPPLLSLTDPWFAEKKSSGLYLKAYEIHGIVPKMYIADDDDLVSYDARYFVLETGIEYIVLDSFTRATFEWPLSRERYSDITSQRIRFYRWVEDECVLLKRFSSPQAGDLFPNIFIYCVKQNKASGWCSDRSLATYYERVL